jgi:hypothetical protein
MLLSHLSWQWQVHVKLKGTQVYSRAQREEALLYAIDHISLRMPSSQGAPFVR